MNKAKLLYNHKKTYNIQNNNHIGPCSDISLRGSYTANTTGMIYNDSNSIFFKKEGTASGEGTYNDPCNTLNRAVTIANNNGKFNIICLDSEIYDEIITENINPNTLIAASNTNTPTIKWSYNEIISLDNYYVCSITKNRVANGNNGCYMTLISSYSYPSIGAPFPVQSYNKMKTVTAKNITGAYPSDIISGENGRIIFSTNTNGIYYTDDNGENYTNISTYSSNIEILSDKKIISIYNNLNSIYMSSDNGSSWNLMTNSILPSNNNNYICGIGFNDRLFFNSNMKTYYSDYANSFTNFIEIDYAISRIIKMENNLIAVTNSGKLLKSTDNGSNWEDMSYFIPIKNTCYEDKITAYKDRVYISVNNNIYYSDEEIINWNHLHSSLIYQYYTGLAIFANQLFCAGDKGSQGIDIIVIPLEIFNIENDNIEINGFYIDGNEKKALGLISGNNNEQSFKTKFITLHSCFDKAIDNLNQDNMNIENTMIYNMKRGV